MPECAEQCVQRRYCVARRRLLPRKACRVRGLRGAPQLRCQHQPWPPSVIFSNIVGDLFNKIRCQLITNS